MIEYKVGYIDDDEKNIRTATRNFRNSITKSNEEYTVKIYKIELLANINDTLNLMLDNTLDAIITDYRLNDRRRDIHYSGVKLVEEFLKIKGEFPIIILTGYEEDAQKEEFNDVNKIYDRNLNDVIPLARKIVRQIQIHKNKIETAYQRLEFLKNKESLTAKEEEELVDLDTFIEHSFNKISSVPKQLKFKEHRELLNEVLESAEKLLKELNSYE